MIRKFIILSIVSLTSIDTIASDSITSISGIQIKMHASNMTSGNVDAYSNLPGVVEHGFTLTEGNGTYCLEQDLRTNISTPENTTTSNSTKITVNNCQDSNPSQRFNYSEKMLMSASGYCLTKITNAVSFSEATGEKGLSCKSINNGNSYRQVTFQEQLYSGVVFQSCDASNDDQKWDLELSGDTYKIKSSNQCITFNGKETKLISFAGGTDGIFDCGNGRFFQNGMVTTQGVQSFEVLLDSSEYCSSNESDLQFGDINIMVVEKVVPIIIPM